jgi:hypothetical protein
MTTYRRLSAMQAAVPHKLCLLHMFSLRVVSLCRNSSLYFTENIAGGEQ